jgi:hypothetical protein
VATAFGDAASPAAALPPGSRFDVVVDNNGKELETVGPVIAFAKSAGASQCAARGSGGRRSGPSVSSHWHLPPFSHPSLFLTWGVLSLPSLRFLFVSSAGIYKTGDELPHLESDAVKADSGHAQVEEALRAGAASLPWASFRPQYLTGYGSNKDCEEWFFDRLARGRALPIPGPGVQLTVVAHAEDIAAMLAAAVAQPAAASGRIFNAVGDRAVTLDGMARLCAAAAGVAKPAIVHYDPKAAGVDVKKAFPFRPVHFYAEPRAAKALLGWSPKWSLEAALAERWAFYQASGRGKKDKSFEEDDKALASAK